MTNERMVTRKVVQNKIYKIYEMVGTGLKELDTIEAKKGQKLSARELAKKYNVKKVVIDCTEEKKITYGMPVSEFMKYATVIEDEESTEEEVVENISTSETESLPNTDDTTETK